MKTVKENWTLFLDELKTRAKGLYDPSAWLLFVLGVVPLLFVDAPMVITVVQWTFLALALAGITVVISRSVFPTIRLREFLPNAKNGDRAAALVVFGILVFNGLVFLSLILWGSN